MYALLDKDEEVDTSTYATYLRSQSDADLLDIVLHLDPEHYPARLDAARRETLRRRVLPVNVHTTEERFIRGLALAALGLAAITVLLTVLMTPADVVGPRWVTLDQIPDGTQVSVLMRLCLLGVLRALVVGAVHLALAPLALLTLCGWLLVRIPHRSTPADVKRLAVTGVLVLGAALFLAATPLSSIPGLLDPSCSGQGFWARLLVLLRPV